MMTLLPKFIDCPNLVISFLSLDCSFVLNLEALQCLTPRLKDQPSFYEIIFSGANICSVKTLERKLKTQWFIVLAFYFDLPSQPYAS